MTTEGKRIWKEAYADFISPIDMPYKVKKGEADQRGLYSSI